MSAPTPVAATRGPLQLYLSATIAKYCSVIISSTCRHYKYHLLATQGTCSDNRAAEARSKRPSVSLLICGLLRTSSLAVSTLRTSQTGSPHTLTRVSDIAGKPNLSNLMLLIRPSSGLKVKSLTCDTV